ncbi:hypothetical protein DICPUDRAFT_100086 [Dictyostelium purpureum]|uniref:Partial AB-hydrolase lipase domain-containing protein n=1 Tax=Dictyostelium purpureum TaxID=5786 RepID=F1A5B4_DICPU|nr:uncharacterized protein DICPUDRAFT_100086 [Dictyostelium purpureum]EGC28620.1 hypothetical protein DICPUDRAFT_100086 [Dictyostelium purpureum]|eukprot:XP_003294858.1 hypothetical protein DICPUDRAFT_100086 [Dictyostelium purpureum]
MLFGLRKWVAKKITNSLDTTLISINETLKTFIEEVWQLIAQLANIVIVAVLGLFYKQGYQSYWEQKNRIKRKSAKKPNTRKKQSPFVQLLNEVEQDSIASTSNSSSLGIDSSTNSTTTTTTTTSTSSPTSPVLKRVSSGGKLNTLKKSPSLEAANNSSRFKSKTKPKLKKSNFSRQDFVHHHEQITTGLLEDIRTNLLLFFDASFGWLRSTISSILNKIGGFSIRSFTVFLITFPFYFPYYLFYIITSPFILFSKIRSFIKSIGQVKKLPNKIISGQELDIRTVKEIIEQSGYPYEKHYVTTEDGYILELERIPNKKSTNVLYLQHGVFDNSFAWIATGPAQSLAFAAYDQGYDVFLGNLRGNGDRLHQNSKISSKDYWDFSMNEHAFLDIPAFIQNIRKIKIKELYSSNNGNGGISGSGSNINTKVNLTSISDDKASTSSTTNSTSTSSTGSQSKDNSSTNDGQNSDGINISAIAHSMGAGVLLMYIVRSRMLNKSHYLSKAILLSPAGYHKVAPKIVDILAPLINIWLYLYPLHVFRFPNQTIKVLVAKIYHDVMSNLPAKDLLVYLVSRYLLGGDMRNHPLTTVHNIAYNTFNGTSVGIYRHFWQIRRSKKFEAFDYGPKKNLELYGTVEPLNILSHYNLIDIPIHFVMGLKDNLIDPVNIIKHYTTLKRYNPQLAFLKASKNGHIEFTLGLDDQIRSYILNVLHIPTNSNSNTNTNTNSQYNNKQINEITTKPKSPNSSPLKKSSSSKKNLLLVKNY